MATYRLSAQMVQRARGMSSVAAAAYRSGERIQDLRTGVVHDYTRRGGVEDRWVQAPEDAPAWARDRAELWNRAELAEIRKDGQPAREFQLSLPHELTPEQQKELVRGWVDEQLTRRGMVADVAIHRPHLRDADARNVHAHVLTTTRLIADDKFAGKAREWGSRDTLQEWRVSWERSVNQALERAGSPERVSAQSLAVQRAEALRVGHVERAVQLDRVPQVKLGRASTAMLRRGVPTERAAALGASHVANVERFKAWTQLLALRREQLHQVGQALARGTARLTRQTLERTAGAAARSVVPDLVKQLALGKTLAMASPAGVLNLAVRLGVNTARKILELERGR